MHACVDMREWRRDVSLHLPGQPRISLPGVMASDRCSDCIIGLIDSVQRRHHGNLHCYGILDFAAEFKGLASVLFDLCIRHILV